MADEQTAYDLMNQLDRLEELREDLLEVTLRGGAAGDDDEIDEALLRREMAELGVASLEEIEARMADLNAQLDALEAGEDDA